MIRPLLRLSAHTSPAHHYSFKQFFIFRTATNFLAVCIAVTPSVQVLYYGTSEATITAGMMTARGITIGKIKMIITITIEKYIRVDGGGVKKGSNIGSLYALAAAVPYTADTFLSPALHLSPFTHLFCLPPATILFSITCHCLPFSRLHSHSLTFSLPYRLHPSYTPKHTSHTHLYPLDHTWFTWRPFSRPQQFWLIFRNISLNFLFYYSSI